MEGARNGEARMKGAPKELHAINHTFTLKHLQPINTFTSLSILIVQDVIRLL